MRRAAALVLLVAQAASAPVVLAQETSAQENVEQETSAKAPTLENVTVEILDRCLAASRTGNAICESLTAEPTPRAACLTKVLVAQQDCLDHVPIAGQLPPPTRQADRSQEVPTTDAVTAREPQTNVPPPPSPPDTRPLLSTSADAAKWVVSETTSPIDYSPVVLAAIAPFASSGAKPPTELVVGCRGMRIELALRTGQTWLPARDGGVEVAIAPEGGPTRRGRWIPSPSGQSAVADGEASEILRELPPARTLVSVADGGGRAAGVFDLTSIDQVRGRIWQACGQAAAVSGGHRSVQLENAQARLRSKSGRKK